MGSNPTLSFGILSYLGFSMIADEVNIYIQRMRHAETRNEYYWAAMIEDQFDAYGKTPEEALGRFMLELQKQYVPDDNPMPYVRSITVNEQPREAGAHEYPPIP